MSYQEYEKKTGYSRVKAWYLVVVMAFSFGMGELSHFLVGTTTRSMAQELHYGDQSCFKQDNVTAADLGNVTCPSFKDQTTCDALVNADGLRLCLWNYNGQGIEYQLLAGPSFILAFSIGGIIIGALADRFNRIIIFSVCILLFSTCTIVMGTAQQVWQLIVLRFGVALGEAACKPISAGLVLSVIPLSLHASALGLVNWGIYIGYGLSFIVGTYIPPLDIMGQGWRWAYYLTGIPGFFLAVLMLLTLADPRKHIQRQSVVQRVEAQEDADKENADSQQAAEIVTDNLPVHHSIWQNYLKPFLQPSVLMLLLGACIRQTAGYSWSYNSQLYHDTYFPDFDVGLYLFGTSVLGGSIGILVGGVVSDRIVKRIGLQGRAWVLMGSQLLASPLAAGVLLLEPPYNFISLLAAYSFAEMWMGILFAILLELVPANVCSIIVGMFLFVMNNVGGNLPVVIAPIKDMIGFRETLFIFYPGGYLLSALVFACVGLILRKYHK